MASATGFEPVIYEVEFRWPIQLAYADFSRQCRLSLYVDFTRMTGGRYRTRRQSAQCDRPSIVGLPQTIPILSRRVHKGVRQCRASASLKCTAYGEGSTGSTSSTGAGSANGTAAAFCDNGAGRSVMPFRAQTPEIEDRESPSCAPICEADRPSSAILRITSICSGLCTCLPTRVSGSAFGKWQEKQGSNLRPSVLETDALPTELFSRIRKAWALPHRALRASPVISRMLHPHSRIRGLRSALAAFASPSIAVTGATRPRLELLRRSGIS